MNHQRFRDLIHLSRPPSIELPVLQEEACRPPAGDRRIQSPAHRFLGLLRQIRTFLVFTADNDPYGEHDLGTFQASDGLRLIWKIDCYDRSITYGPEDSSNPEVNIRVLTVMLASEY